MGATSSTRLVYKLLIHLLLLVALIDAALGQGAQMVGGRPPTTVTHDPCDIASVFSQLSAIKTNPDCTAGCAHSGQCPADWYPGAAYALSPPSHLPASPSRRSCLQRLMPAARAQGHVQRGVWRDLRGLLCAPAPARAFPSPAPSRATSLIPLVADRAQGISAATC